MDVKGKSITGAGYTEITMKINQPPTTGSCSFQAYDNDKDIWYETNAGIALIQTFKLACDDKWVDPDKHRIVKYVFKSNVSKNVFIKTGIVWKLSFIFYSSAISASWKRVSFHFGIWTIGRNRSSVS